MWDNQFGRRVLAERAGGAVRRRRPMSP
jgi:hypothetical protein